MSEPPWRGGGRARATAAAAAREEWLLEKVEASVFARVLQDIEDRCLNSVRLVLQGEGWPARSWQQDGLLVEDMGGRQLRGGGGGGEPAVVRLEAAMRKAEKEAITEKKSVHRVKLEQLRRAEQVHQLKMVIVVEIEPP
jgi:hypothetical protein